MEDLLKCLFNNYILTLGLPFCIESHIHFTLSVDVSDLTFRLDCVILLPEKELATVLLPVPCSFFVHKS